MNLTGATREAELSGCERYRYSLRRFWTPARDKAGSVLFVMLNPSTADALQDDPTIRRCIGFGKLWGYDGLEVVNLYGWRATDPAELRLTPDPVGPDNDGWIVLAAARSSLVVAAWGASKEALRRERAVLELLRSAVPSVWCLGRTKAGAPRHPLYVPADTWPVLFDAVTR